MIRTARILGFAIALWPRPAAAQSREAEAAKVYSAAFDFLFHQSRGESPGMIVLMDSTTPRSAGIALKGRLLQSIISRIDADAIADFEAHTSHSAPLRRSAFSYSTPIVLISLADIARLDTAGRILMASVPRNELRYTYYTYAFARKYPKAWGLTAVSQIGLNAARTQALVYVTHGCGSCFHGETLFLRKIRQRWTVAERIPIESNDGLGIGRTRYLGKDARILAFVRRRQDSTAKAEADSIARDKAPRRVHGTVTNRQTGRPFPRAQIFVRARDLNPVPRAVADSRGRYEFRNLPIGGTMLELQCPGSAHKRGATLDAPSFYMFPAQDTVINMTAPNLEPCWLPRRIHRIERGELEGDPRAALSDSSDDASVFAAVITALYPRDERGQSQALVTQRTYQRCKRLAECPSVKFAALIRRGNVDSTTVRDFRTRTREIRALTRTASDAAGISLLTSGERQYLVEEGNWIGYMQASQAGPDGFWQALTTIYPATKAIVSFAAPGYERSHREALVDVTIETPDGRKANEMISVRKSGGRWAIERRHLESAIVSGQIVAGRCEPVTPDSIPTASDLSRISGEYRFSFISDTGDGQLIDWAARFSTDLTELPHFDLNKLTPGQRQKFIEQLEHRFPWFEVIDTRTGERRTSAEAGTYMESADRSFRSKSGLMQFDGDGYLIDIRAVAKDALFGTWHAFSFGVRVGADGYVVPEPSGHFCASRISAVR